MQLVEGDRLHPGEKPACLSTRSEGERMVKDGFKMIEIARNIFSLVIFSYVICQKFSESFFISHASIVLQSEYCGWDKMESSTAFSSLLSQIHTSLLISASVLIFFT